ncbi:MAG: hypothetical protein R3E66_15860 [bacterium]
MFMLPTQSVNDSISSIIPERIGEQVREGIKQDARVVLMPSYEAVQKELGGGGHSSAAIAQAETLYTQGIGLLTAGEDQKAAEAFQRSVDMMEQNIADLQNYDVLADALANLSLAYFNAKFDVDARKRMKDFAHLRPTAQLDPEKYPKELLEVLTDEQKKVSTAGAGKLNVTAQCSRRQGLRSTEWTKVQPRSPSRMLRSEPITWWFVAPTAGSGPRRFVFAAKGRPKTSRWSSARARRP